jgi:3-deoxy-D-manno-octulosonic-acid transferase
VADLLTSKQIPFIRWSNLSQATGRERVILIDAMGQLPHVYRHCQLAILAGSFSSRIGGHNVLEPCLYGCPVLFGPHMHQQSELMHHVVQHGAGKQVRGEDLAAEVQKFQQNPGPMRQAALQVQQQRGAVLAETLRQIQSSRSFTGRENV